jgi:outer membrane protein OmpA-like peptidoglycan-associated protein
MQPNEPIDQQAIAELVHRLDTPVQTYTPPAAPGIAETVAVQTGIPLTDISADQDNRRLVVRVGTLTRARMSMLRLVHESLVRRYRNWAIEYRVEPLDFPAITFPQGGSSLGDDGKALVDDIVWWLKALNIRAANVIGYSDMSGRNERANRDMALRRARLVAAALEGAGINAVPKASYPAPDQARLERELGRAQFRRAQVVVVR